MKRQANLSESEFMYHDACPECGSSDALSVYSDGHSFCFSCQTYTKANGENVHNHTTMANAELLGHPSRLANRRISEEVCRFYRIYKHGNVLRFHYYDESGVLQGAKEKTKDKEFTYVGKAPGTFFGQHLFKATGRRVVITEGELDAASCYIAFGNWPIVSLPTGAAGAKKAVKHNLQWLQGFEEIVLFFDNDESGRKATEEAASVLPPGKTKIARLSDFKDASEALQAGKAGEISSAIYDAIPYRPDGIIEGKSLLDLVTSPQPPCDYNYRYNGLQSKLHGIRYGELVTVTAGSGIGKSSFCRDIACDILSSGGRVGYLALEESNRRTALGLMSAATKQQLHTGEHERSTLTQAYQDTLANWDLFLFDGFGSFDPDLVYNRIEYMATGLDCRIIFLDHLSILLSGLDGDERRTIDQTMTKLRSLVERTQIALFLVCHVSGDDNGKPYEEGGRVKLNKLRGSRAIGQLSDAVVALERDQQDPSNGDRTVVRVLKNRFTGEVGIASTLDYEKTTCQFNEIESNSEQFDPTTDF